MIYPNSLKQGDKILISSFSNGLVKEKKIKLLEQSKEKLISNGFQVFEDKYVRNSINGESERADKRAIELKKGIENYDAIITATGGDYGVLVLDYLDDLKIKPIIFQGQSDTTVLLYYLTTKYDLATIYSCNVTSFGKANEKQINYNLDILKGKNIIQNSFNDKDNPKLELLDKDQLEIKGRIIGGCLPCLLDISGTKYDYTLDFINKYKNDKIIWYFDIDYMTNEDILRALWKFKNMGWFKNTKLIIFGRVEEDSFTGLNLKQAIRKVIDKKIDIILNADLGHTEPRITIINGALAHIKYKNGKGSITFKKMIGD